MVKNIKKSIKNISKNHNSDVFLFSGTISDNTVDRFILMLKNNKDKKQNCYLFLTTNGGDPDAGYRLARYIKNNYQEFILCVLGSCKSTGTLIALGADKIIMGDFGEFGPLDIQLTKDDELSNTSGLSYLQSLNSLNEQAFTSFEESFMSLKRRSGYTITTKTAAEISTKISVGIIAPISAQIDPIKLGEVQRAINIAQSYGRRLTDNHELLMNLIAGFPSHGFVIDYKETLDLFGKNVVSYVSEDEKIIENAFFNILRQELNNEDVINNLIDHFDSIQEDSNEDSIEETKSEEIIDPLENKENGVAENKVSRKKTDVTKK